MKNFSLHTILLILFVFLFQNSCSIFEKTTQNPRSDLPSATSVVTEILINELRTSEWIQAYNDQYVNRPIIIVGNLHTMGTTNLELITLNERELAKNSQFRVIRAYFDRNVLDAQIASTPSRSKTFTYRWAKNQGADFILLGGVNPSLDSLGSPQKKHPVLDLSLISIDQQKTVWKGHQPIE